MNSIFNFIINLGIGVNFLVLIVLWKNDLRLLHHKLLFIVFSLVIATLLCLYGFEIKSSYLFFTTYIPKDMLILGAGPLLLLYVKSIILPTKGLVKANLKHFIFPLLYLSIYTVPSLIRIISKGFSFECIKCGNDNFTSFVIFYSLAYCVITLRFLIKAQEMVKQNYANIDKVNLDWIKKFLIGTIIVISLDISTTFFEVVFSDFQKINYVISISLAILLMYLGYHGVFQATIFLPDFLLKKHGLVKANTLAETNTKLKPTTILEVDDLEVSNLKQRLEVLMKEEKVYLKNDISLKSLAQELEVSDKKLSHFLNQHLHTSFHDFINKLRVAEVKKRLSEKDNHNYTLLSIALDSGFNSKSSFNRIFVKEVGMTPSQYKLKVKS